MRASRKTQCGRRHVNASELAQLAICERRVLFEPELGKRHSQGRTTALMRGSKAHADFYDDALQLQQAERAQGRCFIATAVYGESTETAILRRFRDEVLLRRAPGRRFVAVYYRIAPPFASVLERSSVLAFVVRLALKPLVFVAALVTNQSRNV